MTREKSRRAVAYCRKSTSHQELSIKQQVDWIRRVAEDRGLEIDIPDGAELRMDSAPPTLWRLGDVFFDSAISGAVESRPGFLTMMRWVNEHEEVGFVLAYDRSRIGRFERSETGTSLERNLTELGITLVFQKGEVRPKLISDGPQYEDLAAAAEWIGGGKMRVDLAEVTLRGLKNVAQGGFWCGGSPPYGFVRATCNVKTREVGEVLSLNRSISGKSGEAVVIIPGTDDENQERLKVVRFVCEEYGRGLKGLGLIASDLNRRGVPSPYAGRTRRQSDGIIREVPGKWTVNSVRGLIENPVYAGRIAYGRREYGSIRRFSKDAQAGHRKVLNEERKPGTNKAIAREHRDMEKWLLVEPAVPYPPVIPFGLYKANLKRLLERGKIGNQRGMTKCRDTNKYPLAIFCGDCGHRMVGHNHGPHATWMCSTYINSHKADCHNNWVFRNEVVSFAVEQVRRRIHGLTNREHLVTALKKAVEEHQTGNTELEVVLGEAKTKVTELRDQAKRTYLDHSKARSDSERQMTREAYDAVHEELTRAEFAQERLEADLVLRGIANEDQTNSALAYLERFDRFLNQLPPDQLRRTFDALGVRIDIQFEANQERGSRRLRMPVGGTMSFGAQMVGRSSAARNDSPPADAEGGSSNNTWLGCGGRI